MNPLRDGVAPAEAPDLDLEHGQRREVRDLGAVLAAEHVGLLDAHPAREDAVERVGQEPRARGHLEQPVLAREVVLVLGVELAQVLDAVHELGNPRRDVVVAVEADRAVRDGFRAGRRGGDGQQNSRVSVGARGQLLTFAYRVG